MRRFLLFAGLFALAACGGGAEVSEAPEAEGSEAFAGAELENSAFTRERVLALNAIVARSLEAINAYDRDIAAIRASVTAAVQEDAGAEQRAAGASGLEILAALQAEAGAARNDFDDEVAALKESGEPYNESILAGMRTFVERVDREIADEAAALAAQLESVER